MAARVGSVVVDMVANTAQYEAGMKRAANATDATGKKITQSAWLASQAQSKAAVAAQKYAASVKGVTTSMGGQVAAMAASLGLGNSLTGGLWRLGAAYDMIKAKATAAAAAQKAQGVAGKAGSVMGMVAGSVLPVAGAIAAITAATWAIGKMTDAWKKSREEVEKYKDVDWKEVFFDERNKKAFLQASGMDADQFKNVNLRDIFFATRDEAMDRLSNDKSLGGKRFFYTDKKNLDQLKVSAGKYEEAASAVAKRLKDAFDSELEKSKESPLEKLITNETAMDYGAVATRTVDKMADAIRKVQKVMPGVKLDMPNPNDLLMPKVTEDAIQNARQLARDQIKKKKDDEAAQAKKELDSIRASIGFDLETGRGTSASDAEKANRDKQYNEDFEKITKLAQTEEQKLRMINSLKNFYHVQELEATRKQRAEDAAALNEKLQANQKLFSERIKTLREEAKDATERRQRTADLVTGRGENAYQAIQRSMIEVSALRSQPTDVISPAVDRAVRGFGQVMKEVFPSVWTNKVQKSLEDATKSLTIIAVKQQETLSL